MSTFDIALPPHNPATCTREHCGRCRPPAPGPAKAPAVKINPHNAEGPRKHPLIVQHVDLEARMVKALDALRRHGGTTWQRAEDWAPDTSPPKGDTRGGGGSGEHYDDEDELRRLERQASGYWSEVDAITKRLMADLARFSTLVDITNPAMPKTNPLLNLQGCELCTQAGLKEGGKPLPFDHTSNVGERLNRDMRLCAPHYDYIRKHDTAPTNEQTRHWFATGTWKVKV